MKRYKISLGHKLRLILTKNLRQGTGSDESIKEELNECLLLYTQQKSI